MPPPTQKQPNNPTTCKTNLSARARVIGLDMHPDSFAAAILEGRDPLTARVAHSVTGQRLEALEAWAARHTTAEDLLVIEASANTFAIVERLEAIGRRAVILESHRAGQIGKAYLANDRLDAAKLARIYLSGLSTTVWKPDALTRERRELLSTYQRCVKESTRARQQLRSYLNEHALRLPAGFRLCRPEAIGRLRTLKEWSPRQRILLEEMHASLIAARERRGRLRRMMALELEGAPELLKLYRLSGLNLVTTYALIAIVGDIGRFKSSKNLVSYLGLNPSVVESGEFEGGGALKSHGRGSGYAPVVGGTTGATSFTDTTVINGTAYYYVVRAVNAGGNSANSTQASAQPLSPQQAWRLANFGTISNSGNAADSADPDGDGMTNAQEYTAGTNPNDRASVLKISVMTRSGNDMLVSFTTISGKTYALEASNTLLSNSWATVQSGIAGTGGTVQVTDTGGAAQPKRFYRVVVQ